MPITLRTNYNCPPFCTGITVEDVDVIRPCPFCGAASLQFFHEDDSPFDVRCDECDATVRDRDGNAYDYRKSTDRIASARRALLKWNRRAGD